MLLYYHEGLKRNVVKGWARKEEKREVGLRVESNFLFVRGQIGGSVTARHRGRNESICGLLYIRIL